MLKLHESEQNWDGGKAGREASRAARLLHVCLSVSVCLTSSTGIVSKHKVKAEPPTRGTSPVLCHNNNKSLPKPRPRWLGHICTGFRTIRDKKLQVFEMKFPIFNRA